MRITTTKTQGEYEYTKDINIPNWLIVCGLIVLDYITFRHSMVQIKKFQSRSATNE